MVSKKQIKANRKNSKKSTGPKNTSKTKYNALKHGILSRDFLMEKGHLPEETETFQKYLKELVEECKPQSKVQLTIIEEFAIVCWRKQRCELAQEGSMLKRSMRIADEIHQEMEGVPNIRDDYDYLKLSMDQLERMLDLTLDKVAEVREQGDEQEIEEAEAALENFEKIKMIKEVLNELKVKYSLKEALVPSLSLSESFMKYQNHLDKKYFYLCDKVEEIRKANFQEQSHIENVES